MNRNQSLPRRLIFIFLALAGLLLLILSLRPAPVRVSIHLVESGHFREIIEEEGRTRLPATWQMAAPSSGFLQTVLLEPGDRVEKDGVLFRLEPVPVPSLDLRTREQTVREQRAAGAEVKAAQAALESARAEWQLAKAESDRATALLEREVISMAEWEVYQARWSTASAAVEMALHASERAVFQEESLRVLLETPEGMPPSNRPSMEVLAPVSGIVLRRHRWSAGPIQTGEVVLDFGIPDKMEVQVDLLSTQAVRIQEGMNVELVRWGGDRELHGKVRRIEPAGFTRVSALGVDEQRVPVQVAISSPRDQWESLGLGYRVEARFILWEADDVLQIPVGALFRKEEVWFVFVVSEGRAHLRQVETGRRSGIRTQILAGLSPGEVVILHPDDRLHDGVRVKPEKR